MSIVRRFRARAGAAAILLVAAVAACEGRAITEVGPSVQTVIRSVATPTGAQGAFAAGAATASGSAATFTVTAPPAAVVGGTAIYTLSSTQPFQQAIVTIEGYDGYFTVNLPAATNSADLLVTFQQEQLYFTHNLAFNGIALGGGQGNTAFARTRLVSVGTGDVQVSVFFDDTSDVDLHVYDPTGAHIYFGNKTAASGGTLDLDANAACRTNVPQVNNENITFPTGSAPRGPYRVHLDYFAACGTSPTRYVVTVAVKGQPVQVFSGTFTGTSSDAANRNREIVRFSY